MVNVIFKIDDLKNRLPRGFENSGGLADFSTKYKIKPKHSI